LHAFDRTTATGRRDYSMARCLVDLGLRASEVASLQLDDVNWREGTVRIAKSKSKRRSAR
jgi:integrase